MATRKPNRSPAEIEDIILRKLLLVSLTGEPTAANPRVVYLELIAAELLSEGKPLLLSRRDIDGALFSRLSADLPPAAEPPFQYLVGCYRRAQDELKKIANMKDQNLRVEIETAVKEAKSIAISYFRIYLANPDMFPSGQGNSTSPRLLDLVLSAVDFAGTSAGTGVSSLPGFLEEFFRDTEYDTLEVVLKSLYEDLRNSVVKVSPLGNFQQPLRALVMLVNYPNCVKALINHQRWLPRGGFVNGRAIEMSSILGPFFHVSAIPDSDPYKSEPDVGQQCFLDSANSRPADLLSSFSTIKTLMNNLYDGLSEFSLTLLKSAETREMMLDFLAEFILLNSSRSHLQVDPFSCASSGSFVNLSAVMLRLCEPFLDANLSKRDKIDPKYVLCRNRLDLSGLTALHASSDEVAAWIESGEAEQRFLQSQEATISGNRSYASSNPLARCSETQKYSFVCECFFMTARALNLGLL